MTHQIAWGQATLMLNHERFEQGYHNGRRYYFEDWPYEQYSVEPMTADDLLRLIAVPDTQDCYQLEDGREISTLREGVEELLGVLIGYLSGPLHPEQPEELQQRISEDVVIDESAPSE